MIRSLAALVDEATRAFEDYDYARVLQRTESFFWRFCDDYLELVKGRRYGEQGPDGAGSANAALRAALSVILRLFAPFLPYVTEEVWSWWQAGSIHRAPWPSPPLTVNISDILPLSVSTAVLAAVRKAKSAAQQSMKAEVALLAVAGPAAVLEQ